MYCAARRASPGYADRSRVRAAAVRLKPGIGIGDLTSTSKSPNILTTSAGLRQAEGAAVQEFFATHPVFTYDEFAEYLASLDSTNVKTRKALLAHYARSGRLVRVRRGLYAAVPYGRSADRAQPDPFLLASRMTPDAVLAYHTTLEFHGRAYSTIGLPFAGLPATGPAPLQGAQSPGRL